MAPRSSTADASASAIAGAAPRIVTSHSRPPMKRAEGTGSPKALTLISVSRLGSSGT